MNKNNGSKWFWIIILIFSIQLIYKFKFREPYPSLCYPAFAWPSLTKNTVLSNLIRKNRYHTPSSKNFNYEIYQNDYLINDYYDDLYHPIKSSYEFYVYKSQDDSLKINPTLLFQNPLSSIMANLSIKSRFWDFPKSKDLFWSKGAAYTPDELFELETFLLKRAKRITKEKDLKYIRIFWTDKKSKKLVKIVRININ